MKKIGFLGLGVMGLSMAKNLAAKWAVLAYDPVAERLADFAASGGTPAADAAEICASCDIIFQILPNHAVIRASLEQAIALGKPGNILVDLSSTAPDIILDLYAKAKAAGMTLLDSPVSGGVGKAAEGTLAIMCGGDRDAYDEVEPFLAAMGQPMYTGGSGSGSVTKLANNMMVGIGILAIDEAYAFAAKAGIDLQTTFSATRDGYLKGVMYDNAVPHLLDRQFEPGARVSVHRKDLRNAVHYAESLGVDLPLTNVALGTMEWMCDRGWGEEDHIAMVRYYEDQMGIHVGKEK